MRNARTSSDKDKKLIVFGGVFGAGKSTFIHHRLEKQYGDKVKYILPDELVPKFGFQRGTPEFHHKIIERMIREHLEAGESLLFETTLNSDVDMFSLPGQVIVLDDELDQMPSDLERMRLAKKKGYEVELYYLSLGSPKKHLEFVDERAKTGGTKILFKYIVNRFQKSLGNLPQAMLLADKVHLIDNSNRDFREVFTLEFGKVTRDENTLPCYEDAIRTVLRELRKREILVKRSPNDFPTFILGREDTRGKIIVGKDKIY